MDGWMDTLPWEYSLSGTAPANAAERLQLQSSASPTHPARTTKQKNQKLRKQHKKAKCYG